ncbi:hypothetical protein CsSME_00031728 [Camellia sinensis var. sinensis]
MTIKSFGHNQEKGERGFPCRRPLIMTNLEEVEPFTRTKTEAEERHSRIQVHRSKLGVEDHLEEELEFLAHHSFSTSCLHF